jgi:hypothetical protein
VTAMTQHCTAFLHRHCVLRIVLGSFGLPGCSGDVRAPGGVRGLTFVRAGRQRQW